MYEILDEMGIHLAFSNKAYLSSFSKPVLSEVIGKDDKLERHYLLFLDVQLANKEIRDHCLMP